MRPHSDPRTAEVPHKRTSGDIDELKLGELEKKTFTLTLNSKHVIICLLLASGSLRVPRSTPERSAPTPFHTFSHTDVLEKVAALLGPLLFLRNRPHLQRLLVTEGCGCENRYFSMAGAMAGGLSAGSAVTLTWG